MTDYEYSMQMLKYMGILAKHHIIFDDPNNDGLERLANDLEQVFNALPAIIDQVKAKGLMSDDMTNRDESARVTLDSMKYLANLATFAEVMKPLAARYNPSEEDKKRFLEFIGYKGEDET